MNTSFATRYFTRALLVGFLFAIARSPVLSAPLPPSAGEPKDHSLFMGADFSVEWNKEFYPVISVSGGSFVIYPPKGKLVMVPMNQASNRLQLRQTFKLSESAATVGHLQVERAYTSANDPQRILQAGAALIDYNNAQQDGMYRTNAVQGSYSSFLRSGPHPVDDVGHGAAAQAALDSSVANSPQLNSAINNVGSHAADMQNELDREQFDALEVSFEVSSDRPLTAPYLIVIARHHAPDGKPGALRDWIHAEALDPIDSQPRKIHFKQGGLAPGFQLKEVQLHLYNHGEEIATSVADKRMLLTRTEAFRIMLVDYLGAHKGATVPATWASGRLSKEARAQLGAAAQAQVYYVRVAKDGRSTAFFEDAACTKPAPESVRTLVDPLLFYPALENGKAVESVLPVRLSTL